MGCPYCVKVVNYFDTNKIPFKWIDTNTEEGDQQRDIIGKKYKWKTVPMIFIDGQFIGGCDDFFAKKNKG